MYTIHTTRFKELGFTNQEPGLWRFVDISEGIDRDRPRTIGPMYASKAELLADLTDYAAQFGATEKGTP